MYKLSKYTPLMSQSLQFMVTMERFVDALVREDHQLQMFWSSKKVLIGEEVLKIYEKVFETWNKANAGVVWHAYHSFNYISTTYVINVSKNSKNATTIIVRNYFGQLQIWFNGPLISNLDGDATLPCDVFNTCNIAAKKSLLISYIKRN